jgi:asparagine synthase (glutamine-hydrolysing)
MCGIAGILSFGEQLDLNGIQTMLTTLVHRGPDGEGTWVSLNKTVALGHRRLSIIDLSDSGKQPMHYANNRYSITFNGEIYNYIELKHDLQTKGYTFHTGSDTEVLLALYDCKKESALQEIDGMFAFAIWDEVEQTLFCARDRFGEKPFYYYTNSRYFAFASEMKALFTLGIPKDTNQKRVYQYLLYTTLEDPIDNSSTFYSEIKQLEAAHYLIISPGKGIVQKKNYWELNLANVSSLSLEDSIIKFRELFALSVERRLRSDVPVGSSLSGGLDSSSIVLLIEKLKKKKQVQKTFSARFNNFARDEGKFMQLVIDKANLNAHFVFPTSESVIDNLPKLFYHQEEPIGSLSVAIQYEVMKLAAENGVTVLLDGQGADEMLAGYPNFWPTYFSQLYKTDKKKFKNEIDAFKMNHGHEPIILNRDFKWKSKGLSSYKYMGNQMRKIKPSASGFFMGIHPDLVNDFKKEDNPIFKTNSLKEHLAFYLQKRGLNELLRYADRNSMAHSIEVRLPFLNHDLVEFCISLPENMLLNGGWSKYILRKSMENILPTEITWRKDKIGFEPPQAEWMNNKYFIDYKTEAINYLKKEKIIKTENPILTWNYISLFAFKESKKFA